MAAVLYMIKVILSLTGYYLNKPFFGALINFRTETEELQICLGKFNASKNAPDIYALEKSILHSKYKFRRCFKDLNIRLNL